LKQDPGHLQEEIKKKYMTCKRNNSTLSCRILMPESSQNFISLVASERTNNLMLKGKIPEAAVLSA
jgi:hypothetical protein